MNPELTSPRPRRESRIAIAQYRCKPSADRHLWEITPAWDVILLILLSLSLWLLYGLREIFFPLLIALVLAYIFNPLVTSLEHKSHWPRPWATEH